MLCNNHPTSPLNFTQAPKNGVWKMIFLYGIFFGVPCAILGVEPQPSYLVGSSISIFKNPKPKLKIDDPQWLILLRVVRPPTSYRHCVITPIERSPKCGISWCLAQMEVMESQTDEFLPEPPQEQYQPQRTAERCQEDLLTPRIIV